MNLGQDDMRARIGRERVIRMATVDDRGRAHVVPVIFAVDGDVLYSPTDRRERPPKRMRNLESDKRITILADFYDEDWLRAWWVRVRGTARVVHEGPERDHATGLLDRKYEQFAGDAYTTDGGPVIAIDIEDWTGWAYGDGPPPERLWRRLLRRSR